MVENRGPPQENKTIISPKYGNIQLEDVMPYTLVTWI